MFNGLREGSLVPEHGRMEQSRKSPQKERRPSDFLGAFCFVILIATVLYAVLTAS